MHVDERLLKPIPEVTYLNTENTWRYRAILRFFYRQHERLRHYLFPEEVYNHLKQYEVFASYSEEMLEHDLQRLVAWGNLIPRQETGKVSSIEEFKRKKFRYQCSPYTVEIERMVHQLEQLGESFGGSLERTLFDRLLQLLSELTAIDNSPFLSETERVYRVQMMTPEEVNRLWEDLFDQFRKLTENATDYLAYLKSEKIEDLMQTEDFLLYKEALTTYLRNFMSALQKSSLKIESILLHVDPAWLALTVERVADYQMSIPRMDEKLDKQDIIAKLRDQWSSLRIWFLGINGSDSEMQYMQNETNETIRKMTRFAQRLGERYNNMRSRRKDYLHLAEWFLKLPMEEAHKLSACVFGVFHTRHLFAEPIRTEDIDTNLWRETPTVLPIRPRTRNYRERTRPNAIEDRSAAKEQMLQQHLLMKEAERRLIEQIIRSDRIRLSELQEVDPYVRKTLLQWIARAGGQEHGVAKTETGRRFKVLQIDDERIELASPDGVLQMPNYLIMFLD